MTVYICVSCGSLKTKPKGPLKMTLHESYLSSPGPNWPYRWLPSQRVPMGSPPGETFTWMWRSLWACQTRMTPQSSSRSRPPSQTHTTQVCAHYKLFLDIFFASQNGKNAEKLRFFHEFWVFSWVLRSLFLSFEFFPWVLSFFSLSFFFDGPKNKPDTYKTQGFKKNQGL